MDAGLRFAITTAFARGVYIYVLKRSLSGYPPAALTVLVNTFAIAWYPLIAI